MYGRGSLLTLGRIIQPTQMSVVINILLFIFSGLFSLVFFGQSSLFGFGDTMVSKSTVLYLIGGFVLILGAIARVLSPEIRAISE